MSNSLSLSVKLSQRMSVYSELSKMRLTSLVVFSSLVGYIFGKKSFQLEPILLLAIGGSLVTFSSNAINQLLERENDKLMDRTKNRPLPTQRLSSVEAILFAGITAFSGIVILSLTFNPLTGVLAALSLLLYGFFYTPLKKITPLAVFIGAIPGALPPLIGYVAATNVLDLNALWIFFIQFFWQFPHFWAIAWVSYDDYLKGGIMLLPSKDGKSKSSALIIMLYTFLLIPLSLIPFVFHNVGTLSAGIIMLISLAFFYQSVRLMIFNTDKEAKKLMFYSFGYLMVFLIALFF